MNQVFTHKLLLTMPKPDSIVSLFEKGFSNGKIQLIWCHLVAEFEFDIFRESLLQLALGVQPPTKVSLILEHVLKPLVRHCYP